MSKPLNKHLLLLILILLVMARKAPGQEQKRFDLSYYKGRAVSNNFGSLVTDPWIYKDSEIESIALAYHLDGKIRQITFETEGQFTKHSGLQDHWESNFLLNTRLTFFENGLATSISYGQGISYAFGTPYIEQDESTRSNRLLNYFQVELTFGLKYVPHYPRLFFRIHHRSGVFGVYCGGGCGSNFPSVGIRAGF
jgi:hypothetical protein